MAVAAPGSCLEQQGPIFQASISPQSQKPPPDDACIWGKKKNTYCMSLRANNGYTKQQLSYTAALTVGTHYYATLEFKHERPNVSPIIIQTESVINLRILSRNMLFFPQSWRSIEEGNQVAWWVTFYYSHSSKGEQADCDQLKDFALQI